MSWHVGRWTPLRATLLLLLTLHIGVGLGIVLSPYLDGADEGLGPAPPDGGTSPADAGDEVGEIGVLFTHSTTHKQTVGHQAENPPLPAGQATKPVPEPVPEQVTEQAGPQRPPITGTVVDERAFRLPHVRIEASGGSVRRTVMTDAHGDFTLSGLPMGPLTLTLRHPGFAPLLTTGDLPPDIVPLQLVPGGGIEGEVRERRLGSVPQRVRLALHAGGLRIPIAVGRDGRFHETSLPAGTATLEASAPGFVPLKMNVDLPLAEHPDTVTLRDVRLDMEILQQR